MGISSLHMCLTGLPEVAMPYSDMVQDCQKTLQHTRPCYAKSSCRSVDPQTLHGNVHQVDHVPNGPTNSAAITTMFPLRLCGGKLLVAVTRERRNTVRADYALTTTTTADKPCKGDEKGPFGWLSTQAHSNLAMPLQGPQ